MINYKSKIRARTDYRDKLLILKLLTVFPVRSESKNVPTFPVLHEENISISVERCYALFPLLSRIFPLSAAWEFRPWIACKEACGTYRNLKAKT